MTCPKCGRSLGIMRAEDAKVGAMFIHRKGWCDAILVLTFASVASIKVRFATKDECGKEQRPDIGVPYQ